MANEPEGEEQKWWLQQNRWIGVWAPTIIVLFAVGVTALSEGRWGPGILFSALGLGGLWVVDRRMKNERVGLGSYYVAIIAVVLTWVFLAYDIYVSYTVRVSQSQIQVLGKWGGGVEMCDATIIGSRLSTWDNKYRVALVCGFQDPKIDCLDDTRITVSRLFRIKSTPIFITADYSKAMTDGIKVMTDEMVKGAPKGSQMTVHWGNWYQVVVVPDTLETSDIHRLSDVTRLGGALVGPPEGVPVSMDKTVN